MPGSPPASAPASAPPSTVASLALASLDVFAPADGGEALVPLGQDVLRLESPLGENGPVRLGLGLGVLALLLCVPRIGRQIGQQLLQILGVERVDLFRCPFESHRHLHVEIELARAGVPRQDTLQPAQPPVFDPREVSFAQLARRRFHDGRYLAAFGPFALGGSCVRGLFNSSMRLCTNRIHHSHSTTSMSGQMLRR